MIVSIVRWLATIFFLIAGILHFVIPEFYQAMIPPFIPFKDFFIVVTGIAEMAGAIGIQIPKLRKLSGILMMVLLISIFPANIYVAAVQPALPNLEYSGSSMWWRLLLQPVFIGWIWLVSVKKTAVQ